ncbi:MAG TPA: ATP-binding protein [Candidatus Limnocylindrales bacterium]|nr:ATP-binding protein [Candidatus Limnocylindrales bacterium]
MTRWTGHATIDRETSRWLNAPPSVRYGTAVAIIAIALVTKYTLLAAGLDSNYLLLIPAIIVAALLGGFGPGVLVTIVSLVVTYVSTEPTFQIGIEDPEDAGRLTLLLIDGVLLSALAGALRSSMRQLAASRAQADLEHGRTSLLQDLTARVASETDATAIAHHVLVRSSELVGCDRGWIVVEDAGATGGVRVLGALDHGAARESVAADAAAASLASRTIADGEELWIDAGSLEHDRLVKEHPAGFGASAAIAVVPLRRASGEPFGGLLLVWSRDHEFKAANRDLKRAVARITAQALERAELSAAQVARISDLAEREVVRDAFLAVLSHELRTPVTTIIGASDLLRRTAVPDDRGLLVDIQEEAERLRRIVDDLLVLSRSERGAIELSPEPILVQRVIASIVGELGRRYPGATLQFSAPEFLPAALADPTALVQVVHNLVTNAIKYAGVDGPIEIATEPDGPAICVTVADHGPGLGDDPDTVFVLFHRARHTATRAAGTGIGLYVARELVHAMGGDITGTNRPEGGARFRFTLPLAETPAPAGPLTPAAT